MALPFLSYICLNNFQTMTPKEQYEAIAKEIHSDISPVGIDAKKTHIMILQKLIYIEQKLEQLEGKLNKG